MLSCFTKEVSENTINIEMVSSDQYDNWLKKEQKNTANWLRTSGFSAKSGRYSAIPAENGEVSKVIFVTDDEPYYMDFGALSSQLPDGVYNIQSDFDNSHLEQFAIAWALGS